MKRVVNEPSVHLEDVVPRLDVRDVDPLAVDVVAIQIPASHRDALLAEVGTLVPLGDTWRTTGQLTLAHRAPCCRVHTCTTCLSTEGALLRVDTLLSRCSWMRERWLHVKRL